MLVVHTYLNIIHNLSINTNLYVDLLKCYILLYSTVNNHYRLVFAVARLNL